MHEIQIYMVLPSRYVHNERQLQTEIRGTAYFYQTPYMRYSFLS